MAIKRESLDLGAGFEDTSKIDLEAIKKQALIEARQQLEIEAEQERLRKIEEEKNKTLWGYSITLSYMKYYAVRKTAEFLIANDDETYFVEVPEGQPTEVKAAVVEILDEHIRKNAKNPEAIMYRYVINYKVFK